MTGPAGLANLGSMKTTHLIVFLGGILAGALIAFLIVREPSADTTRESPVMTTGSHTHALLEIDQSLPRPGVRLEVFPDAVSGLNLHLVTTSFTFTPELVNTAPRPNEGHAHVFVNGVKVGRVYGDWYHLDGALLTTGSNLIEVTLNANDHAEWTAGGEHITAAVTVTR